MAPSRSRPPRSKPGASPALVSLGVVVRRTGLSADTLRVWERRHGVVTPVRTPGGARRYSDADVQRLILLRDGVAAGGSIGELARLPATALAAVVPPDAGSEAKQLVARYLARLKLFDAAGASALLSRALLLSPAEVVFDITTPILQAIGDGWASGRTSVGEEHLASFQLRVLFSTLLGGARPPSSAPAVVLAAPPDHRHELSVLMAAALTAARGLRPVVLGADTPIADMVLAADRAAASLVVLGMTRAPKSPEQKNLSRELLAIPCEVWLGVPPEAAEGWPPRMRVLTSLQDLDRALAARFGHA